MGSFRGPTTAPQLVTASVSVWVPGSSLTERPAGVAAPRGGSSGAGPRGGGARAANRRRGRTVAASPGSRSISILLGSCLSGCAANFLPLASALVRTPKHGRSSRTSFFQRLCKDFANLTHRWALNGFLD